MRRIWFVPDKPQKRKTICVLHDRQAVFFLAMDPMEDVNGMVKPCDLKPRIASDKNTWKRTLFCVFSAMWSPRILPNTVTCSRSLQRTASSLHWERGMYENSGWALPKGSLNSESATSRAKIELAIWSTRSTKPRRKVVLGTIKRFEKLRV